MGQWYWHKKDDTEPRGPVSKSELKELAAKGMLKPEDMVWQEGMDDWEEAADTPELFVTPPDIAGSSTPPETGSRPDAGDHPHAGSRPHSSESTPVSSHGAQKQEMAGGTPHAETHSRPSGDEPSSDLADDSGWSLFGKKDPEGVGGWLLLFCIILTIFTPLWTVGGLVRTFIVLEEAMEAVEVIGHAFFIEAFVSLGIMVYGFVTGVVIWSGHKKGRKKAKRYLAVRLALFILVQIIVVIMITSGAEVSFSAMWEELARSLVYELIFFGVWFAYFTKSKRVANTYGPVTAS